MRLSGHPRRQAAVLKKFLARTQLQRLEGFGQTGLIFWLELVEGRPAGQNPQGNC